MRKCPHCLLSGLQDCLKEAITVGLTLYRMVVVLGNISQGTKTRHVIDMLHLVVLTGKHEKASP